MIAELAICNAAFAVIKEAVQNSGDLASASKALFKYFDSKASIQKQYEASAQKANSNDIEEFFALEKLRAQEIELREMMQWNGRAGMWDDWLRFQADAARKRREEKEAKEKAILIRRNKIEQFIEYVVIGVSTAILACLLVYGIILYIMYLR